MQHALGKRTTYTASLAVQRGSLQGGPHVCFHPVAVVAAYGYECAVVVEWKGGGAKDDHSCQLDVAGGGLVVSFGGGWTPQYAFICMHALHFGGVLPGRRTVPTVAVQGHDRAFEYDLCYRVTDI